MSKSIRCNNCIHDGVCYMQEVCNDIEEQLDEFGCNNYKDKSRKCKNGIYDNRHLEAKKPFKQEMYDFRKMAYCPSCSFNDGTIFQLVFQRNNYCPNCGQELDWDEEIE